MPEPSPAPPEFFTAACRELGWDLSDTVLGRLSEYLDLLMEANRSFNLTAIRDRDTAWDRHILDSLSLLPYLPEDDSIIDIGSGGGLPGIVLAITHPDRPICLLEATGKKARFLEQTAAELGLDQVSVVADRAETAGHEPALREQFDVAIARAVADLPALLEFTAPFVRKGGRVLAMKGKSADKEIDRSSRARTTLGLGEAATHYPLKTKGRETCVIGFRKIRATPKAYPRLPGTPAKHPL